MKISASKDRFHCSAGYAVLSKKLEKIFINKQFQLLGASLFKENKLELSPFEPIPFLGWGNWEQDPFSNRSWQWRLNWLSFLPYLISYHHKSLNVSVLHMAKDAIESWHYKYIDTGVGFPFEFIWHDHCAALRAEQLLLFWHYCNINSKDWLSQHTSFSLALSHSLQVHGERLADESFYSKNTNHGLEQARVLLLLGSCVECDLADEWRELALERINSELNSSFTDEGVHKENSPAYHVFVLKVFIGIAEDYSFQGMGCFGSLFAKISADALRFVTHVLRPDGTLPPIGDTEQLPSSDAYRGLLGSLPEYQEFVYALTLGKRGVRPPVLNRVYAMSGYAVFRDKWPSKEHYQMAVHLITKIGSSSRYHHQQDEGSVSLYARGEDWLIDSGLYNYDNSDPVRRYMRSRSAHNIPLVSHAGYAKEFEHRLRAWRVTDFAEDPLYPFVEMIIEVMEPVVHRRRVSFDAKTAVVEILDDISAKDDELRNITLQWHFPQDKKLVVKDNRVLIHSPLGNSLRIEFEGDSPDRLSVVSGRKGDRVLSCISYKANQVEPSQLLKVLFQGRRALNVVTRFAFSLAEGQSVLPEPAE